MDFFFFLKQTNKKTNKQQTQTKTSTPPKIQQNQKPPKQWNQAQRTKKSYLQLYFLSYATEFYC